MGANTILRTGNNDSFTIGILDEVKRYLVDVHGCWPVRETEGPRGILTNCMCALRGQPFCPVENGSDLWQSPRFNDTDAKKRTRLFAQKSSSRFL